MINCISGNAVATKIIICRSSFHSSLSIEGKTKKYFLALILIFFRYANLKAGAIVPSISELHLVSIGRNASPITPTVSGNTLAINSC